MTTIFEAMQHPSITALAWTLIHFVWQGALLGGAAFMALRMAWRQRAATRYAMCVATLAAMVITCALTFALEMRSLRPAAHRPAGSSADFVPAAAPPTGHRLPSDSAATPAESPTTSPAAWPLEALESRVLSAIVIAWLAGVGAMSVRLLGGWLLARRMVRRAAVAVSPAIAATARAIASRLQIRRTVAILESHVVAVPTLIGWLQPVVLLPAAALAGLSPEQLRAILAHELAHVRRHDYLVNLLQSCVETLLFYHPATWWVSAQIRAEREHCCDDLAVAVCGDRLVYASALAELTAMAGHQGLALAATDGSLLNRVRRILGGPRSIQEPAPAWPLLALVVLVVGAGSFGARAANESAGAGSGAASPATRATAAAAPASATAAIAAAASPLTTSAIATAEQPVIAATSSHGDAEPADQSQAAAIAAQLREQAAWLAAEAARLRAEAESLRDAEAQLGAAAVDAAPPLPPLPPLPPEPSPVPPPAPAPPPPPQDAGLRGSGNMTWSDNGESISIKWSGAFRLNDDETDIEWMDNGATITITDGVMFRSRVDLRGTANGIERSYSRNGLRREYEPDGRLFVAAAIDRLIRHSGAFARERVARFLARGGPDAVLAQIDRLSGSNYVRRVYYSELLKQAPPTDALLATVLDRVTTEISSNHDKAELFTLAARLSTITDAHRVAIARAVKSISSGHDQRRSLVALVKTRPLAAPVAAAIVDAAGSIGANHDRAETLIVVAAHGGVTGAIAPAFMARVRTMSSSHDQRRVLTAVLEQGSLADGVGVEIARAAGAMSGSHDLSSTLIAMIDRGALTDGSAQAFFDAAARVTSSHDLSRVLRKVVERSPDNERLITGVLKLTPQIGSSHDRANVLTDLAARARIGGEARQLYLAAATGLGSHDENRALAALVRAEGRR